MKKVFAIVAVVVCAFALVACNNQGKEKKSAEEAVEAVEEAVEDAAATAADALEGASDAVKAAVERNLEKIEAVDAVLEGVAVSMAEVEVKPTFNGGTANDFQAWVQKNLQYPEAAIENGEEGTVLVSFNVDKEGNVENVKVVRGVTAALDEEATRVVTSSPAWTAGQQGGVNVDVNYVIPIRFALQK